MPLRAPADPPLRWLALALAAGLAACFTGDGLVAQPCERDEDCNPIADAFGEALRCLHNVCGYTPRCGDGIVDEAEECDHGDLNVDDDHGSGPGECSASTCRLLPHCGDGVVQSPREGCDDGNDVDADACPRTCVPARCGDGFVGPGEACDPQVDEDCTDACARPDCGDGVVQPGEDCDDGNAVDADACLNTCVIATCGDGFVHAGQEECDDANADHQDNCVAGCVLQRCGDGFVGPGEACDDGNQTTGDACTNACAPASCHDGVVQPPEECDDGNDVDEDDCLTTCLKAECGDSVVGPGEECDDGNHSDGDACLATCKAAGCGDGFVGPGEACDDGNKDPFDACILCEPAACGDGYLREAIEECDDGNAADGDGCSASCHHENCGDGIKQPTEACDDGNKTDGDGCSGACAFESCGDGVTQAQEVCDDGNDINTDDCVHCQKATCGDGVTWKDKEVCDDGNKIDGDACLSTCKQAACGDGAVWTDHEACDDGNKIDDDACLSTCKQAACGDGVVWDGVEQCDDGNQSELDPCRKNCTPNVCGDGHVDATAEGCDDKDSDDNDGCSNKCQQGAEAIGVGSCADHFCAIRAGKVRCWGRNDGGQLGIGSNANLGDEPGELPDAAVDVLINEPDTKVLQVVVGDNHTCVRLGHVDPQLPNAVRCWGVDGNGALGFGLMGKTYGDGPGELPTTLLAVDAIDLAAGRHFTCAVLAGGGVRCWGWQDSGRLGQPNAYTGQSADSLGNIDLGPNAKALQVAAGENHACALLEGGSVRCWGGNSSGQLGLKHQNTIGDDEVPATEPTVNVGGVVTRIAAGDRHTCAVLSGGSLRCWGSGGYGVLGYGDAKTVGDDEHPADAGDVKMLQPGDVVVQVVVDNFRTCVLLQGGGVRCWGDGGSLGYFDMKSYGGTPTKPPLVDLGAGALALAGGGKFAFNHSSTCALLQGGRIRCWGDNSEGQLGRGDTKKIGDDVNDAFADVKLYPNP